MPLDNPENVALLSGNSNKPLAEAVARALGTKLIPGEMRKFADGEVNCSFNAQDVQGKDCYIMQPTCRPVNDSYMELLFMVSACRRSGAKSVTVITPYYGYARQDRRFGN